jgi:hypothetical protein
MATRLNGLSGRLEKLERRAGPTRAVGRCRDCGWEHAPERVSLELIRAIIGPVSVPAPADRPPRRTEPFCACTCCGEHGRQLNGFIERRWGEP